MLKSMTGFGHSERQVTGLSIQLDLKGVNHRYCEINVKMPREWLHAEDQIKKRIQQHVKRGRLDVFISISTSNLNADKTRSVQIDWTRAQQYLDAARQLQQHLDVPGQITWQDIWNIPNVVIELDQSEDRDQELVETALFDCLDEALVRFSSMRNDEGEFLHNDLSKRLEHVVQIYSQLRSLAPNAVQEQTVKLKQRMSELLGDVKMDENRLAMEVAILADRMNIDEELTRLASHCQQFEQLMKSAEPVGRKLDFLLQEMNREANTIGAKSNFLPLQNLIIELKAELEKIREQVQNIE